MATHQDEEAPSESSNNGESTAKATCCGLCPFFMEHTLAEAGGSRYALPWVMATFRVLGAAACIAWGIRLATAPMYSVYSFDYAFVAMLFAISVTFLLLAVCSVLHGKEKESTAFAKVTLFLHSQAILFVIMMLDIAVVHFVESSKIFVVKFMLSIILPVGLYLIDIVVLQSRMRLRYVYQIIFVVLLILKSALWPLYAPHIFSSRSAIVRSVGASVGIHVAVNVMFFGVIGITHLPKCCNECS